MNLQDMKIIAEYYKDLYNLGLCDREEAKEKIMPYIDYANEISVKISKKYKQKPKLIKFISFIR